MSATESVPMVGDGLINDDSPALLGSHCIACGAWAFPAARPCVACGGDEVDVRPLSTEGTIYSFTIVRVPVPGYCGPVPYGLGVVELERERLRVGTLLTAEPIDALRIGAPVTFTLVDVGAPESPLTSYAYAMAPA